MYALIDCNNFYASCERVFDPSLRDKPVAILSNNDGCVIARSEEAKQAGVTMGGPAFKLRDIFEDHKVAVLSSNYALYGDMSRRVIETLNKLTASVEPYSIDEAFVQLSKHDTRSWNEQGQDIREAVGQWTGIPVSVGIAPSKTLAKLANETAKAHAKYKGVLNLADNTELDNILKQTPVKNIWGIGPGFSQRLFKEGIYNALQLKNTHHQPQWIRSRLKVNGLRTVMELNGEPCLEVSDRADARKGIMTSRSFGETVTELCDIKEAVANFVSIAAQKLRAQQSVASVLSVTLRTSKYARQTSSKYKHGLTVNFPAPTANTLQLIQAAQRIAEHLFTKGNRYKKAAVMLTGIIPQSEIQTDLFSTQKYDKKQHQLMDKVDEINTKYGKRTTLFAGTGLEQPWQMKQEYLSKRFTTCWDELVTISAD